MIDTVMIEVPNPAHPYGVKGVGEVPIVPPLAAIGNAVSHAIGKQHRGVAELIVLQFARAFLFVFSQGTSFCKYAR